MNEQPEPTEEEDLRFHYTPGTIAAHLLSVIVPCFLFLGVATKNGVTLEGFASGFACAVVAQLVVVAMRTGALNIFQIVWYSLLVAVTCAAFYISWWSLDGFGWYRLVAFGFATLAHSGFIEGVLAFERRLIRKEDQRLRERMGEPPADAPP